MANSDKNLLIRPAIGSTTEDPKITFFAGNSTAKSNITITMTTNNNGQLSIEGSAGQLFSITNNLNGTLWAVNDISGIPLVEVVDDGNVILNNTYGNVIANGYVYAKDFLYYPNSAPLVSFNNTRARAAVGNTGAGLVYYEANGNFQVNIAAIGAGVTSVNGLSGAVTLYTANITESHNTLYYTDTRVWSNVGANIGTLQGNVANLNTWVATHNSTSGIVEGSRLYYTDVRVWSNVGANIGTLNANVANLNTWVATHNSTTGIIEGTNQYYTNVRVWANLGANIGLLNANVANLNTWVATHNSTTGILEGTNLYFTNTKARAAVGSVGSNLTYYEANGRFQITVPGSNQQLIWNNNGTLGASSGLTYDGSSLSTTGNIQSLFSSGSEGGEIFLSKSATGTTINTGVTVDVYADKLRFFEAGGTNRGFYIDITTGGAGAGTNLVGGGSSVTSVGSYTGAVSNAQLLGAVQTGGTSITFDQIISSNNSYGTNFKVGDDAWIGDYNVADSLKIKGQQNSNNGYVSFGSNTFVLGVAGTGELTYGGNKVFHAGNDGAGSTLDADLLDGFDSSYYANTSNITEGTKLFYTDVRVWSNVGSNIGTLQSNVANLNAWVAQHNSTSGIIEGSRLYYTDTRVWSNVGANIGNLNAWVTQHNSTSGIVEGTNLYFTNTRARAAVGASGSNLTYYEANGRFQVNLGGTNGTLLFNNSGVGTNPNVVFDGLTVSVPYLAIMGREGDEGGQFQLAPAVTNTSLAGNIIIDISQNRLRFFEGGGSFRGAYIDLSAAGAGVGSNLLSGGGGGGVTSVNGLTGVVVLYTANITESHNTLYYTDTRVWSNVGANIGNLNAWVTQHNSTSGIIEGSRLYYLDTRVWSNVGANIGNLNNWATALSTTSGVAEGTRLYYLDTRVWSNVGANLGTLNANVANLNTWAAALSTTSGVAEGTREYFTNARANSAIVGYLNSGVDTRIGNANIIGTLEITGAVIDKSNIQGSASGSTIIASLWSDTLLYFTGTQGSNVTFNATGLGTHANVGDTVTFTVLLTNSTTPYYINTYQVDGTAVGVTTRWAGGVGNFVGTASNVDMYQITIFKTAATPTYSVFVNSQNFF